MRPSYTTSSPGLTLCPGSLSASSEHIQVSHLREGSRASPEHSEGRSHLRSALPRVCNPPIHRLGGCSLREYISDVLYIYEFGRTFNMHEEGHSVFKVLYHPYPRRKICLSHK